MTERKLSNQISELPNLSTASETRLEIRKDYESGAFFKGYFFLELEFSNE